MKYDLEFKLARVKEYLGNRTINCPTGLERGSFIRRVKDRAHAFNEKGIQGLEHKSTSKRWTIEEKLALVSMVLAGKSITSVARENFINSGQLYAWVKKYRENGYDGLKLDSRGRKPKVINMAKKQTPPKISPSEYEELQLLRERNKYLEAENIYLKKLRALELKKQATQAKAKKQK